MYCKCLIILKTKIAVKPDFMTHLKTLNAIYSKAVFCDLVTFRSKPFNCFMLPAMSCSRRRSCCNDPDSFS